MVFYTELGTYFTMKPETTQMRMYFVQIFYFILMQL
jgi:hypothetical protein